MLERHWSICKQSLFGLLRKGFSGHQQFLIQVSEALLPFVVQEFWSSGVQTLVLPLGLRRFPFGGNAQMSELLNFRTSET